MLKWCAVFLTVILCWMLFERSALCSAFNSPETTKTTIVFYSKEETNLNPFFSILAAISILLTSVTMFMLVMNKRDVMCVLNGFIVLAFCSFMAINAEKYSRIWSIGKSLCKIYLILCFYWSYFMIHLFRFTSMIVCDRQSILMIFEKFAEYSPILSLGLPLLLVVLFIGYIRLCISPIHYVMPTEFSTFINVKWLNGLMFGLIIIPGILTSFLQFGIIYLLIYKRQSAKKKLFQSSLRKQDIVKCIVNLLSFFLFMVFQTLHFSGYILGISNFFNCLLGVLYFICFGLSSSFRTTYSQFFIKSKRPRASSKFKNFEKRNSGENLPSVVDLFDVEARCSHSSSEIIASASRLSNSSFVISEAATHKTDFSNTSTRSSSVLLNLEDICSNGLEEIAGKTHQELSNFIEEINTTQHTLCQAESGTATQTE